MSVRFPNESAEYRAARDELLAAERELRRKVEEVAALRRRLPPGGVVPEDYVFATDDGTVRLSELFGAKRILVLYSYMFGPPMARPCPSCTSILDGLDGQVEHVSQRVAFAVVAKGPIADLRAVAGARGWRRLRLVSSGENSFNRDYHAERAGGGQNPLLHVFTKNAGGEVRHSWTSELLFADSESGQDPRHVDAVWPLWNLLDTTPEGRGDFYPKLAYE